ncbi:hypothetical protein [Xanthomonas theicola]|nr:hypothetical protein [Xanthomonas theicola]
MSYTRVANAVYAVGRRLRKKAAYIRDRSVPLGRAYAAPAAAA